MKAIVVNGQNLPVREYKGQRVVTIKDIARVHGVNPEIIRRNFNRNKKHFIINIDYYSLHSKDIARVNLSIASKRVTNLNVFTESGYLMLVKSLGDELSWKIQRELVRGYFRKHNGNGMLRIYPLLKDKYKQVLYYRVKCGLTQEETARVLGCGTGKVYRIERRLREVGIEIPRRMRKIAYQQLELKLEV